MPCVHVLVIEGGGMKAAYANGVLSAFEDADFAPWDAVIGTSAGGALAAWYSAGQARYAEKTWDYAADPRILSYRRALRGGPLLDHEALLDIVYVQEHPIDVAAVRAAPWPVIVTAVDADTGEVAYQDVREGDTIGWLKATGRLPFASGPPVELDGRRWVDGGTVDPVPVRYAVEQLGATELTLITNKPPGHVRQDPRLVVGLTARRYPALRAGLEDHQRIKAESVRYALDPPEGVTSHLLYPTRPTRLGRLSRNLERIREGLDVGRADGAAFVRSQTRHASTS